MEVPESVTWFGSYRLTARIATGGMAEVYLGRKRGSDNRMGPAVAVKRLLPHLVSQTAVVRMFLNEARITAQISHPNVVRILDLGVEGREPFISMELLEGRSLADLRQTAAETGQRVPLSIMLRVLAEACRGLDAAHRAKDENGRELCIVHRDFSPDNIHVGVDGQVKVIDFGIATAANVSSGTEPGTLKGKFFYMSPEMIAGNPVDHRADLFAAGVMLYEQLCGRRPFTGLSTDEVLSRIAEGKPRPPSSFDPSVPPVLEAICLTALSHHPENRFPSLKELIQALESVESVSHLATREELAEYVNSLFPAERDPQRKLLREARQRDPSIPRASSAPPTEFELPTDPPGPAHRELMESFEPPTDPPGPADRPGGQTSPPGPITSPPAAATPKHFLAARFGVIALAVLLLAGVGGLFWWAPWRSKGPEPAEELRRAVETKLTARLPEEALALARRYGELYPQDNQAALLEARAYVALRQGKRADAALDRASQLDPSDAAVDLVRFELRQAQGDIPGALDALTSAQRKRPGDRSLQRQRALLLSKAGRLDEAETALIALLQRRFDAEAASELAFVKLRKENEDTKEAVALLRRVLKRRPKLPQAHYYLGTALARQGDSDGAERAYRDAMQLAPMDPRPLSALCQLLARNGRTADADAMRTLLSTRFPEQSATLGAECR